MLQEVHYLPSFQHRHVLGHRALTCTSTHGNWSINQFDSSGNAYLAEALHLQSHFPDFNIQSTRKFLKFYDVSTVLENFTITSEFGSINFLHLKRFNECSFLNLNFYKFKFFDWNYLRNQVCETFWYSIYTKYIWKHAVLINSKFVFKSFLRDANIWVYECILYFNFEKGSHFIFVMNSWEINQ